MFGSAGKSSGTSHSPTRTTRRMVGVCCALIAAMAWGCQPDDVLNRLSDSSQRASDIQPASFEVRAQRRAFDGAPPVIPHVPFGADCVTCHTSTGQAIPTVGAAPANPHLGDPRVGALENCRQCHLFVRATTTFQDNTFEGLPQERHNTDRAYPLAPPMTPHPLNMRANCIACHSGPAARPEIVCTHPERANCLQCHLVVHPESEDQQPIFSSVLVP
jgi:nitrate reductase cytochrome c-type subunit